MERRPDAFETARLILARQRALGVSFEVAWARVVEALTPAPGMGAPEAQDLDSALAALDCTREEWEAAHRGLPVLDPATLRGKAARRRVAA